MARSSGREEAIATIRFVEVDTVLPADPAAPSSANQILARADQRPARQASTPAKSLGHNCTRPQHIPHATVAPTLHSPTATLLPDCGADAEAVRDQLAAMLLYEAPELATRLHKRWSHATLQIHGLRKQPPGSQP